MSDLEEREPQLDWEKKPVPFSFRIKQFRDGCRWLTLLATIFYLMVNLLRLSQLYAQHRTAFMIFDTPLPTSQIRALLDFDQAWKVTVCATVFLGIVTLPRWQGFLALAVVFMLEFVIGPVTAI